MNPADLAVWGTIGGVLLLLMCLFCSVAMLWSVAYILGQDPFRPSETTWEYRMRKHDEAKAKAKKEAQRKVRSRSLA